jgi:hypothetical protein
MPRIPTPPPPKRCSYLDCQARPAPGLDRCEAHRFRPQTVKEAIAAGPKWDPVDAESSVKLVACATGCSLVPKIDRETGLCLVCWRVWRFAAAGFPAPFQSN